MMIQFPTHRLSELLVMHIAETSGTVQGCCIDQDTAQLPRVYFCLLYPELYYGIIIHARSWITHTDIPSVSYESTCLLVVLVVV